VGERIRVFYKRTSGVGRGDSIPMWCSTKTKEKLSFTGVSHEVKQHEGRGG